MSVCSDLFDAKAVAITELNDAQDNLDAALAIAIVAVADAEATEMVRNGKQSQLMNIEMALEANNCYQQAAAPSGGNERDRLAMEAKHRMRKLKWAYIDELLKELCPPKPSVDAEKATT